MCATDTVAADAGGMECFARDEDLPNVWPVEVRRLALTSP